MRRVPQTLAKLTVAAAFLMSMGGCAPRAKVIRAITHNTDQIKFLYTQGSGQGIIKCRVAADGALSQCREMAVVLEGEE